MFEKFGDRRLNDVRKLAPKAAYMNVYWASVWIIPDLWLRTDRTVLWMSISQSNPLRLIWSMIMSRTIKDPVLPIPEWHWTTIGGKWSELLAFGGWYTPSKFVFSEIFKEDKLSVNDGRSASGTCERSRYRLSTSYKKFNNLSACFGTPCSAQQLKW